jgi:type IV secretory pathway VirB3-like protein
VKNFVWKHNLINIHEIMMMNILHQLMKKMIMHLLIWIKFLLKIYLSVNRKRKNFSIRFKDLSELDKFDTRFKNVSSFIELKTFFSFSNVKQWIDVKQKTIMKQIIFIIISLLIDKWFHAVNFVYVLVDFILIAQYRSYDEQILRYLN